jgi:hypothetical protein
MPNGAHQSHGRGRVCCRTGPTSALWRSALTVSSTAHPKTDHAPERTRDPAHSAESLALARTRTHGDPAGKDRNAMLGPARVATWGGGISVSPPMRTTQERLRLFRDDARAWVTHRAGHAAREDAGTRIAGLELAKRCFPEPRPGLPLIGAGAVAIRAQVEGGVRTPSPPSWPHKTPPLRRDLDDGIPSRCGEGSHVSPRCGRSPAHAPSSSSA